MRLYKTRVVPAVLTILGLTIIIIALWYQLGRRAVYDIASDEYNRLRDIQSPKRVAVVFPSHSEDIRRPDNAALDHEPEERDGSGQTANHVNALASINPDYIGWIKIPGTVVDYPVVQGVDNGVYLNTLFSGETNAAGAIFMDARCEEGFDAPICVLYGHSMKDGSMFAQVKRFLDKKLIEDNPDIIISTDHGEELIYQAYAARRTDAWDEVYSIDFTDIEAARERIPETPKGASRLLILSTCLSGADKDARALVFAALISNEE